MVSSLNNSPGMSVSIPFGISATAFRQQPSSLSFGRPIPRSFPRVGTLPFPLSKPSPKPLRRATRMAASSAGVAQLDRLVFDTEEELSASLARYIAELSHICGRDRGAFSVVLSGGSLIKALRKLTEAPHLEAVDWGKWHVFWVDERVVPKDHEDSNYKLAFDGFLSKVPIPSGQVHAINDMLSAEGAADDYEACLKDLVKAKVLDASQPDGFPIFDLMLLGMGPDGHVASLFPEHPLLKERQRWVTCIKDSPKPPPERITFTFPVINLSCYIALVVTGSNKSDAVRRALGDKEHSSDLLPVQMISLKNGKLTWFTDKGAISKLQEKASN